MRYTLHLLLVLTLLFSPAARVGAASNRPPDIFDAQEIESFLDGVMASELTNLHIPGGVVAVVRNGEMIFAKGYGYRDVDRRGLVVADRTLFRLASISKLFVWTAVMQLVEQGKLELNADVNQYLDDFQIPPTFSKPITLLDLMNHTSGFEDRSLGIAARDPRELQPLGAYLAGHMPARVQPPGEWTAYSNYGTALAGYIVSRVSGMPFEQYADEHILKPLDMQHSTFHQSPPDELVRDLATGYTYSGGKYRSGDGEWWQLAPAAGLSATATDMANFMIAQLQNGRFRDQRILQADTAERMHTRSFTNDPRVSGYAYGFAEATLNGERLIGHTGDLLHYHSGLFLLPERQTGFFMAYNGSSGAQAVYNTIRAVMDHYYPEQPKAMQVPATIEENAALFSGVYFPLRAEVTTAGRMVAMLQSIRVVAEDTDHLVVSVGFPPQITESYVQIAPGVFRSTAVAPSVFGDVVFQSDEQGKGMFLFQQNNPGIPYRKAAWYAAPIFNLSLLVVVLLLCLSVIGWLPVRGWLRRRCTTETARLAGLASWWQLLLSVTILFFLIGFLIVFSNPETVYGLPRAAYGLFWLPYLIVLLAIGLIVFTGLAWKRRWWSLPGRIHYTLVTTAGLVFVGWLAYWNLWVTALK